jgi:hypothetical protein
VNQNVIARTNKVEILDELGISMSAYSSRCQTGRNTYLDSVGTGTTAEVSYSFAVII